MRLALGPGSDVLRFGPPMRVSFFLSCVMVSVAMVTPLYASDDARRFFNKRQLIANGRDEIQKLKKELVAAEEARTGAGRKDSTITTRAAKTIQPAFRLVTEDGDERVCPARV